MYEYVEFIKNNGFSDKLKNEINKKYEACIDFDLLKIDFFSLCLFDSDKWKLKLSILDSFFYIKKRTLKDAQDDVGISNNYDKKDLKRQDFHPFCNQYYLNVHRFFLF